MRILILAFSAVLLSACAVNDSDRFLQQMEREELIERTAMEREYCQASISGAWMCTSPSRRANERYPWLHCSCVDNQSVLE